MQTFSLQVNNIEDLRLATGDQREFRASQMSSKCATGRLDGAKVSGLSATSASFDSDILMCSTLHDKLQSFAVATKCDDIVAFGERLRPGDLMVSGPGGENNGRYKSELQFVVINFDPACLIAAASGIGIKLDRKWLSQNIVSGRNRRHALEFAGRVSRIISEFGNSALDGISEEVEDIIQESMFFQMATLLPALESDDNKISPCSKVPNTVRDAEDILDTVPDRKISVSRLASKLGVSQRALYRSFSEEIGMSPYKFLSHYRMSQARIELAETAPIDASVTTIAQNWGFSELGRFSVEYKKVFAESPRQTLLSA